MSKVVGFAYLRLLEGLLPFNQEMMMMCTSSLKKAPPPPSLLRALPTPCFYLFHASTNIKVTGLEEMAHSAPNNLKEGPPAADDGMVEDDALKIKTEWDVGIGGG